jgi:hypothetical protein
MSFLINLSELPRFLSRTDTVLLYEEIQVLVKGKLAKMTVAPEYMFVAVELWKKAADYRINVNGQRNQYPFSLQSIVEPSKTSSTIFESD